MERTLVIFHCICGAVLKVLEETSLQNFKKKICKKMRGMQHPPAPHLPSAPRTHCSSAFHGLFFFFLLLPLPPDGAASCGAGSQLCFLSQSPFMWSLPRVLPVDSERRGGTLGREGGRAGRPEVSPGLALRRLLAVTTRWLSSDCSV